MPPYDPKANRPKLVPVDDESAPVDALLGPADSSTSVAPTAPQRTHLSVVSDDERAPRSVPDQPVAPTGSSRPDPKVLLAVAVTAIAVVVGSIVVARRSSN